MENTLIAKWASYMHLNRMMRQNQTWYEFSLTSKTCYLIPSNCLFWLRTKNTTLAHIQAVIEPVINRLLFVLLLHAPYHFRVRIHFMAWISLMWGWKWGVINHILKLLLRLYSFSSFFLAYSESKSPLLIEQLIRKAKQMTGFCVSCSFDWNQRCDSIRCVCA